MNNRFYKFLTSMLLALLALTTVPESSDAADQMKKWFPGHYIYADEKTFSLGLQEDKRALVRNNPNITGYHVRYSWATVERAKDNYDFSLIARDISIARSEGKKLIIGIWDRNHQDAVRLPVPKYLTTDPIYEGGVYKVFADAADTDKLMPKLWVPAVAERRSALFKALGKAFDSNPTLAYVGVPETALNDSKKQPGFSSTKLMNGYMTVYTAAASAFPNTIFSQFTNWLGGLDRADADTMMAHLVETTNNGFGGPDALEAVRPFDGKTSLGALENGFGVYYKKYKGIAPITSGSQSPSYQANDALTVLKYAVNQLGANFMSWAPIEEDGSWTIYDAIRVINSENGLINTTLPKNMAPGTNPVPSLAAPDGVLLQTQ